MRDHGEEIMGSQKESTKKAREELLRVPEAMLLADYWLATGEAHEAPEGLPTADSEPLLVSVMPRPVVREARQIVKRRTAENVEAGQAALDRLRVRYSLPVRMYKLLAPSVTGIAKAPWATMAVIATWTAVHTCHHPQVEVLLCAWYPTRELSRADSAELRNHLSQLWISRFAIDTMKTLPDACTAELNRGTPSMPCVKDSIATLERIVISEWGERATIQELDDKLRTWCPNVDIENDPAAKARLLYDTDMVSAWLWPSLYF
jgi:hypothetical protein